MMEVEVMEVEEVEVMEVEEVEVMEVEGAMCSDVHVVGLEGPRTAPDRQRAL